MTTGWEIRTYDIIDSTSQEARRLIRQGAGHGLVVLARTQTAGKGRLGRAWDSAKDAGIWFSAVLEPKVSMEQMSLYSFVAALAAAEGIRETTGLAVQLKWPNDVLYGGRKLCGILLELVAERNQPVHIIAGIGINAMQQLTDFPEDVRHKATSLAIETGKAADCKQVLDAVLRWLSVYSAQLETEGFSKIRERWQELSCIAGKDVQIVRQGEALLYGTALGLADDGALLVQTETGIERIMAGDVSLRAADGGYAL